MRSILALAILLSPTVASAQKALAIDSQVFVERRSANWRRLEPASDLLRGDRIVTVLRWQAPRSGSYTATSPVPAGLTLQAASRQDIEISRDGGRSWQALSNDRILPPGVTHLRWRIAPGEGSLTYRAVVR